VKIIDPIWSGAYVTRNYSDMPYDTLFAVDARRAIRWVRSSRRTEPTSSGRSRCLQIVTHVPLGEWFGVSAASDKIEFPTPLAPVTVFWGISKK
jgi:peptide/nickel transport system substrate-binding protein